MQMLMVLGIVGVCNIFTPPLCLIALSSRDVPLTCYSHKKRDFSDLHLEHAGSDIVSRAPATD